MSEVTSPMPESKATPTAKPTRSHKFAFPIGAIVLLTACSYLQLWLVVAIITFIVYLLIQIRKQERLRQPEHSIQLRRIAFPAQALPILMFAFTTGQILGNCWL